MPSAGPEPSAPPDQKPDSLPIELTALDFIFCRGRLEALPSLKRRNEERSGQGIFLFLGESCYQISGGV